MTDSLFNKKVKFNTSAAQSQWLSEVGAVLPTKKMATLCSCSERTMRDWKRGKFLMPYQSLELLAKAAHIPLPKVDLIDRYEHTKRAGQIGGKAVIQKYGRVPINESARLSHWRNWWENGGKEILAEQKTKTVALPKPSLALAEFIGIMLGDGGLTPYQISITLHTIDDYEYGIFVQRLIEQLFCITARVYVRKDVHAFSIVLGRKKAVAHLTSLGLVVGNKVQHQIRIPKWILKNEAYSLACLRGLMDTDGSVYTHRYTVSGKEYQYKKLCFSSASAPLRKDVQFILHRFGSAATCSGTNVRVDAIADVKRYMKEISTHNPKHLKRYSK